MSDRRRVMASQDPFADKFVDLGLSVKWATGNICKDSSGNYYIGEPTEYGCYFSWGNIVGHNKREGYNFDNNTYNSTPGASLTGDIASNDSAHDAALACLGSGKRMPTKTEWQELIDNCTWTWSNNNYIWGYTVKSEKSGYTSKSIFLPASGFCMQTGVNNQSSTGRYWSSTKEGGYYEYYLNFFDSAIFMQGSVGFFGLPVRAVQSS